MTEMRDRELGGALRELDVPEHRPQFHAELSRRLAKPAPRRRIWAPAAAAALAVVAASVAALLLPRGSDVASAADVRRAINQAFATAGSVSGIFINREQADAGNRWKFVLNSSGSFRITGLGLNNPTDLAYDARSNVETWSDVGIFTKRIGLAPGDPDSGPAAWVVQRGLGTVVAALAASPETKVEEITYNGRPAWLLRTPTGNSGEERLITVDRETGIPVRDQRLRAGKFAGEWRIDKLAVSVEAPRTLFRLRRKADQRLTAYDMGFRRVDLEAVAGLARYEPLVPAWVPAGYQPAEVAFARSSRPTGDELHQNPPSRDVISISYQRGLDRIVVTTRRAGSDRSAWGDPTIGSSVRTTSRTRVEFGGRQGWLVVDPNSVPHIWAIAEPLVVTISGNVDGEELLRIAKSLPR